MASKKTSRKSRKPEGAAGNDLAIPLSGGLPGKADDATLLRLFSLPTILARPTYLATSTWLEHVPFAFWLMEAQAPRLFVELGTRWGVSYFAFCQAAERMGLDLRAFAIDTWDGDPEAGFQGSDVFEKISEHNNALYSEFSRLVRSGFDAAREHFEDGTIDLLHVDGCHDYTAARDGFEGWLPKLSERAIVVLHDSNVREGGVGVHRLVGELRTRYPVFEFTHGQGLAVIGVGERQNASFERLFASEGDPVARKAIHATFSRLGRACADSQMARHNAEARRIAEAEADRLARRVAELEAMFGAQVPTTVLRLSAPLPEDVPGTGAEDGTLQREGPAASAPGSRTPDVSAPDALQLREIDRLRTEGEALRAQIATLRGDLHDRYEEIAALSRIVMSLQEGEASSQGGLELVHREAQAAEQEMKRAQRELAEAEERARASEINRQAVLAENDQIKAALAKAREDVATLSQQAQYWQFENEALRKSTSWRISAPLRAASQAIHRPKKE